MNINTDKDNVYKKKAKVEKTIKNNNEEKEDNNNDEEENEDQKPKGKVIRKSKVKKELKVTKPTKPVNLPNIIIDINDKEINI
jgi:hypothetical protein